MPNDPVRPDNDRAVSYMNHYRCPYCRTVWAFEGAVTRTDTCPNCGTADIAPIVSSALRNIE